ncbi:MAG TPA: methyltransferase domain-containing protein [Candidatus Polarisedimenticolia bacterium]|nr:methyltransferase domain-containing protein [Candidatus Polarisedimenticolia bacterium]
MATREHSERAPRSKIHERVSAQFGAAAAAYSTSLVHSDPAALSKVVELARPQPPDVALDVATGSGNTALALAPHLAQVIAYDMTAEMLAETARNAAARGLANVATRQGTAESLPFPDSTFDIVTVRQAPHHFADVRAAICEMARVAKPGARVIIVDSTSPEDDSLDRQWNYIEKLRDPSHVRNYRPSEWRSIAAAAGLRITFEELGFATENGRGMDFMAWVRRMSAPPAALEELTHLFRNASPALAAALRVELAPVSDGRPEQGRRVDGAIRFCVPQITLAAVR